MARMGDGARTKAQRAPAHDALLREADLQTRAIMRLEVCKRLAYSGLAVGALLVGWGFYGGGGTTPGIVGVVLLVACAPCALILYLGTRNAKRNVDRMLAAYEDRHGKVPVNPKSSTRRYL